MEAAAARVFVGSCGVLLSEMSVFFTQIAIGYIWACLGIRRLNLVSTYLKLIKVVLIISFNLVETHKILSFNLVETHYILTLHES